jgi:hypothetical protein
MGTNVVWRQKVKQHSKARISFVSGVLTMGLDIIAISNLQYLGDHHIASDDDDFCQEPDHYDVWDDDFPWHQDLSEGGCYAETPDTEDASFLVGSCSGYNWWRNALSHFACGVPARTVWEHPDKYKSLPFYELIEFSDCNGTIGPAVCAKLAKDFADHEEQARAFAGKIKPFKGMSDLPEAARHSPDLIGRARYWLDIYRKFQAAFAVGSQNGLVRFC